MISCFPKHFSDNSRKLRELKVCGLLTFMKTNRAEKKQEKAKFLQLLQHLNNLLTYKLQQPLEGHGERNNYAGLLQLRD